jgi:hypothetical protein
MSRDKRLNRTQEVVGSSPFGSTSMFREYVLLSEPHNSRLGSSLIGWRQLV